MSTAITYRVTGWPALPEQFDALRFRRALVAMSVGAVSQEWLKHHCGLRQGELRALMAALKSADLLEVGRTAVADGNQPAPALAERQSFWVRYLAADSVLGGLCRSSIRPLKLELRGLRIRVVLSDLPGWQATARGELGLPTT